jgi:TPP-dependent pyruvate/acetoin dehydrogenase alpha subunit
MTYRFRGHSVADPGTAYRTKDEIAERQSHDPLVRTRALLLERGAGEKELDRLHDEALDAVERAVTFAEASPEPPLSELARGTYAPGSAEQFERMRAGSPFDETRMTFDQGLGR